MQIVWFKRDLRIFDNEVLSRACIEGPIIPVYIFENELWANSVMTVRHYTFLKESLNDLNRELEKLGQRLIVEYGNCEKVFEKYKVHYGVKKVWSHQETWNNWVRHRNINLSKWFKANGIKWIEIQQNGVIRNLKSRDGWAKKWNIRMSSNLSKQVFELKTVSNKKYKIPSLKSLGMKPERNTNLVMGGRREGLKLLETFLSSSGENYSKNMSAPSLALISCSKLSSHISFGTLSIREIFQSAKERINLLKNNFCNDNKNWINSISAFLKRLHWHCHFIQKLEDDPNIELRNLHSLYDGMREEHFNEKLFEAWHTGLTGFPFVDACMRSLKVNGWINFRMRAMLMSFSSYHLWLHWKLPADFLASLFIDFEPGIHYSQAQMQSGTTGINSIRIYNPVKQGKDHDPHGIFIRKWVPEVSHLDNDCIHNPWLVGKKIKNYPLPIVNERHARNEAAKKIYSVRNNKKFINLAKEIYLKHGSRKLGARDIVKKKNTNLKQLDLFK